jgi:CHAT domain-containing protein
VCAFIGCSGVSDRDWQEQYDRARKELWYGHFDDAFRDADKNYHKAEKRSPAWSWRFQTLKAQVLQFQGKSKEALALLGPEVPSNLPADVRARKWIVQGETLCRLRKSSDALAFFVEADGLVSEQTPLLQAELDLARGRCASINDRPMAQKYFSAASSLAHGRDEFVEAAGILNIELLLLGDGLYDEASRKLFEGLKVTASPLLRSRMLGDLGYTYSQLGEFRRAASFSQQAVKIAADLGDRRGEEYYLIDVGREHFHQLEYEQAEASYTDALKIGKELGDLDGEAICLHNLAQLALKTRNLDKAEDYIRRLDDLHRAGGHSFNLLLDRAELAKAKKDFPSAQQLLNQLLDQVASQKGIAPAIRWTAQSDLAAVYAAQSKFDLADKMFREAVASAEATRSKIQGIEYRISFLDYSPFYDQYVKFLVSRNRPLEALAVAEQGRSPTLSEGLPSNRHAQRVDIPRIQGILKRQRQSVLAYWLGWEESYLWVITPTQVKLLRLPPELEIEREIEAYNREIVEGGTLETLQKRGQGLYNTLVGPAVPYMTKGSNVIVIPHRKLYNLAFETLVVSTQKYWIEEVESHNMSFLSALLSSRPRFAPSKDLLLLGAPLLADKQFPVLVYAPAEMQEVAAHFPATREAVISGKDATPGAYLASHPGEFRSIHLVTHGTSSTVLENPLDSAIILSPVPGGAAPAADPEGSYRLYGKDIMKTPLHADLVIISACYGMGREYSGEGLVGLAWAFLRAGAHQVIAALWEVDDASMPQLMDDFYREYTRGKSAADALRDAKLRMLHSSDFHKRPYYWASLQVYTGS